MAKWHLTNRAVGDLDSIWEYTAEVWSELQADTYYGELIAEIGHIANNKFIFDREYSEVKEGLLCHHYRKHLIFYQKYDNDDILVIRILHERMDLPSKLTD
ncbi:MAG: type II toxin-antitoxin system RelE/ParE family toxin [Bacteroidales bacterium]|nr:type II toxin-antitoxin system RelE/ParE family toxin [Bacteroidales bacterium]